jgi:hypothetical protein
MKFGRLSILMKLLINWLNCWNENNRSTVIQQSEEFQLWHYDRSMDFKYKRTNNSYPSIVPFLASAETTSHNQSNLTIRETQIYLSSQVKSG